MAGILVAFGNSVVHQFYDAARSLSGAMQAWEARQWDKLPKPLTLVEVGRIDITEPASVRASPAPAQS
jgi:hypothetical protein